DRDKSLTIDESHVCRVYGMKRGSKRVANYLKPNTAEVKLWVADMGLALGNKGFVALSTLLGCMQEQEDLDKDTPDFKEFDWPQHIIETMRQTADKSYVEYDVFLVIVCFLDLAASRPCDKLPSLRSTIRNWTTASIKSHVTRLREIYNLHNVHLIWWIPPKKVQKRPKNEEQDTVNASAIPLAPPHATTIPLAPPCATTIPSIPPRPMAKRPPTGPPASIFGELPPTDWNIEYLPVEEAEERVDWFDWSLVVLEGITHTFRRFRARFSKQAIYARELHTSHLYPLMDLQENQVVHDGPVVDNIEEVDSDNEEVEPQNEEVESGNEEVVSEGKAGWFKIRGRRGRML
ncbi:hypothetical protein LINPERHAP1_LOCUS3627, partial [Linum perenne]